MTSAPSLVVRRKRERQSTEPELLDRILADGWVAHVAMVRDGLPVVLPYLYGVGDLGDGRGRQLLLHGSTAGGLFLDAGTEGVPVSVAITHLDGLVFARSLFDSSANYRSAMIFGHAVVVPDERRVEALWMVSDHLLPARRAEVREMTRKEIVQTQVLAVPLDQVSVKIRFAGPGESPDDGEDHAVWAGVVPLALRAGDPVPSRGTAEGVEVSPSASGVVATLSARAVDSRNRLVAEMGGA